VHFGYGAPIQRLDDIGGLLQPQAGELQLKTDLPNLAGFIFQREFFLQFVKSLKS
jgi:hypothetical protein